MTSPQDDGDVLERQTRPTAQASGPTGSAYHTPSEVITRQKDDHIGKLEEENKVMKEKAEQLEKENEQLRRAADIERRLVALEKDVALLIYGPLRNHHEAGRAS